MSSNTRRLSLVFNFSKFNVCIAVFGLDVSLSCCIKLYLEYLWLN